MDTKTKYLVYIGDFDFRNENVQAHLVKNNGKILNNLGYSIAYIGINRNMADLIQIKGLPKLNMGSNSYLELPNTLNLKGIFECRRIIKLIISYLDNLLSKHRIKYVISYQAPTYAVSLKYVARWCNTHNVKYIVNCADIPIFDSQPLIRRLIMKINWHEMHKTNQMYADGVIAVSKFISNFYSKPNRQSVIIPPLFENSEYKMSSSNVSNITSFIYAGTPFKITGHAVLQSGMKDRLDKIIDLFLALSQKGVQYSFRIVGITKDDYLSGVPYHKEMLSKESNIVFMGRHSHDETLDLIARSDFSINFRDENLMTKAGFSTKIVESVSIGTPVVINQISDTSDYLEENITTITIYGNIEADTQTMVSLCALSEAERLQIKKRCYEMKTFDISKYVSNMNNFLASVE